jgi:hypothetical protein
MKTGMILAMMLLVGSVAFGLADKMSGPGFFTTVQVQSAALSLKSVDAFVDGDNVFFSIDYSSTHNYDVSFFDPPDKQRINFSTPKAITAGEGTLAFQIPLEKLTKVSGITVMIDPRNTAQFVYFAINGGISGLAHKEAPDEIKKIAVVYTGTK